MQGGFAKVYSCSKVSIGGYGMEPYAIKIVPKRNVKKNGEGGIGVQRVSCRTQHTDMYTYGAVSYFVHVPFLICMCIPK